MSETTDTTANAGGETAAPPRLAVAKTYKLFVGGAFPRSESGRVYEVTDGDGTARANAPLATRKDARDAVSAARKAFGGWSGATAYNRGQVLYRVAEMLQGRTGEFAGLVAAAEGLSVGRAGELVEATVDRLVWYAGWTDKLGAVLGTVRPVGGGRLAVGLPEPYGVVAVAAPSAGRGWSLLGAVTLLGAALAAGNTVVLVAAERDPLPVLSLGEVLAVSDVPGGVVNVLSGRPADLLPTLAGHGDVEVLDLSGLGGLDRPGALGGPDGAGSAGVELVEAAAGSLKEVLLPPRRGAGPDGTADAAADGTAAVDWTAEPALERLAERLRLRSLWQSAGV
ncbi:aldehyde dehydrogenase family protein [Allostreptomyces psammosilenae]|uniref:Aldehyde dehydrogenase domain-containing protein n=1 Tax=Allostreptomyces psammosilenae TaxID=1892865 RepID=A0A853A3H2_9ACTN|nr:aldehyde dehydrogenase family protein [Allostreptomyces psammosilenae]NYI08020.1 hypothetical protein [Allostreptomyces psammosilenae]